MESFTKICHKLWISEAFRDPQTLFKKKKEQSGVQNWKNQHNFVISRSSEHNQKLHRFIHNKTYLADERRCIKSCNTDLEPSVRLKEASSSFLQFNVCVFVKQGLKHSNKATLISKTSTPNKIHSIVDKMSRKRRKPYFEPSVILCKQAVDF